MFGLNDGYFNEHMLAYHGDVNLMKGAIYAADYVTTVSPTYADELQYSFYAHGLEGVIADNRHKLRGILNGIDTEVYDPWRDKGLTKFFSARQMAGKKNCKAALQQMSGLRENPDAPSSPACPAWCGTRASTWSPPPSTRLWVWTYR